MARPDADGSSPSMVVGSLATPRAAALAGVAFPVWVIVVSGLLSTRAGFLEADQSER